MVTAAHRPSPLTKMSPGHLALLLCLLLLLPAVSGRPLIEVNRRSNYVGFATLCQGHPRNCQLSPFNASFRRNRRPSLRAMAKRLESLTPRVQDDDVSDDVKDELLILALANPGSLAGLARREVPHRQ